MRDATPGQQPKPQAKFNGGPPKPPKKSARGLEDESPDDSKHRDLMLRLLDEHSKRLTDPKLSAAERKKCRQNIKELLAAIGK